MDIYFVDTSALVKRYVTEKGSTWLQSVLAPSPTVAVFVAYTTPVEFIAVITRRERGGSLTAADANRIRAELGRNLTNEFQEVALRKTTRDNAISLAQTYALRGYDAIQLASAVEVNVRALAQGQAPITIISTDAELNAAALAEGMAVENLNNH